MRIVLLYKLVAPLRFSRTVCSSTHADKFKSLLFHIVLYMTVHCAHAQFRHYLASGGGSYEPLLGTRLDGLFTVDELSEAVRQLKSGKSPRLDGIAIELYRSFWHICKDDFMKMANTVLSEGTLSVSQQTGVIRLLHKQGSRSDLSN